MKHFILILILFTLFSCNADKKSADNGDSAKNKETEVDSNTYLRNMLVGEWEICVSVIKGLESKCNVCPKVRFDINNKALLNFPTGEIEVYTWNVKDKRLVFSMNGNRNIETEFPDSVYEMSFTYEKDFLELKLIEIEKKYTKILRR